MRDTLRGSAEAVKAAAIQGTPGGGTGATGRSYEVTEVDGKILVINTDPFFHLTEWGSVNNPPYAPLRRGVQTAGLRLSESTEGLSLTI